MQINSEIASLRAHVKAAREEFDLIVVCYDCGSLLYTTRLCISAWVCPTPRTLFGSL
jgi:hypothetical protein